MSQRGSNLAAALLSAAATRPQAIAVKDFSEQLSFGELLLVTSALVSELRAAGIDRSTHVGIALEGIDFVEAYLAVLALGAVAVPLNPRSPAFELGKNLSETKTAVLFGGPRLGPHGVLDVKTAKETALPEVEYFEYGAVRARALETADRWATDGEPISEARAREMLEGFYEPYESDPATLIMTGGTSGTPKAAMLTHRCMLANLRQLDSHTGTKAQDGDVALGVLPLFHIFGLNVVLGFSLYSGCVVAFPHEGRLRVGAMQEDRRPVGDPEVQAAAIRELGVTVVSGSPNLYRAMLESDIPRDTFSSVRVCTSGAAALSGELFDAFAAEFGRQLWEGYGMTEASPVISSSRLMDEPLKGCVGLPLPGIELEIRDPSGEPIEEDDHGEIFVKGENVFAGYFEDPEETSQAISDGWLKTGDIGVVDEVGRLYLVDRSKDVVIVGGFNVYPAEIETLLMSCELVAEAAVTGEKRADDERLVAFVVPSKAASSEPGSLEKTLGEYLSSKLSRYKVPRDIRIVEDIPKTALNKVSRRRLG
jgi:long-chain acyl-CoA synthetase